MRSRDERRALHVNARPPIRNIQNSKSLHAESYDLGGASSKAYKKININSSEFYIELKGEKE